MNDENKIELLKLLNELHDQAHVEFNEWNIKTGKPTLLVDKMQDLTFFIAEIKKDLGRKKYTYDHVIKSVKWLTTNSENRVVGHTIKPKIFNGVWITGRQFTSYYQDHIQPYAGNKLNSLEKVELK